MSLTLLFCLLWFKVMYFFLKSDKIYTVDVKLINRQAWISCLHFQTSFLALKIEMPCNSTHVRHFSEVVQGRVCSISAFGTFLFL